MFKYINEHPEYNITTEISRIGRRQSILHSIKEHCLAKQIQIYIKDLDFKLLDDNGKVNQQGEIIFTLFGLFAESEVKQSLKDLSGKEKTNGDGFKYGKLLFGYDRSKLENKKEYTCG
jgi:DNA invertase Pin-like site-specific DNA recombinase